MARAANGDADAAADLAPARIQQKRLQRDIAMAISAKVFGVGKTVVFDWPCPRV